MTKAVGALAPAAFFVFTAHCELTSARCRLFYTDIVNDRVAGDFGQGFDLLVEFVPFAG